MAVGKSRCLLGSHGFGRRRWLAVHRRLLMDRGLVVLGRRRDCTITLKNSTRTVLGFRTSRVDESGTFAILRPRRIAVNDGLRSTCLVRFVFLDRGLFGNVALGDGSYTGLDFDRGVLGRLWSACNIAGTKVFEVLAQVGCVGADGQRSVLVTTCAAASAHQESSFTGSSQRGFAALTARVLGKQACALVSISLVVRSRSIHNEVALGISGTRCRCDASYRFVHIDKYIRLINDFPMQD